jgi:hypothetical protein
MAIGVLKLVRFIIPAALIILFSKLLGFVTGWWTTVLPDFEKSQYLPSVIVPAAIYYITPLRRWTNTPHHKRITEHLRRGLVQIAGYADREDKYTWKKLRSLFFDLVDRDESLKQKANLAYANGAIWTSFADSTVLAALFFLASMLLYWLGSEDAFIAGMIFLLIISLSIAGSVACTSKQIAIGLEQLEVIDFKYKADVERRLSNLDK